MVRWLAVKSPGAISRVWIENTIDPNGDVRGEGLHMAFGEGEKSPILISGSTNKWDKKIADLALLFLTAMLLHKILFTRYWSLVTQPSPQSLQIDYPKSTCYREA